MEPSRAKTNGNAPEATDFEVAIIGTGFSGLGAAILLKRAGIHDLVVFERADEVGGTWRDNHYPGLCCDVPSHVYSFSFELNAHWTRGFAPGWEIREYLERSAEKYDVVPHIRYRHEVLEAAWDEDARRWRLATTEGPFTAKFLVNGAGALSEPKDPEIPGLEKFKGKAFHSAHWDHDHELGGERVAVIGTGASSIQFVPRIQPQVAELHLYQRTPPWVIPRFDHKITKPEHRLLEWIPYAPALVRAGLYWLLETRVLGFRRPPLMKVAELAARWHLKRQIPDDPGLRRKVTPDYTIGCKRILISDDYYPSLAKPNVEVVSDGIEEIREHSVIARDGTEREVDTIIFGTGFHITDPPSAGRMRGRDGRTLAEHWTPNIGAYLGTTIAGFPNHFLMTGPNTGLGHNSMVFMIESQLNYVVDCIKTLKRLGADSFEVRREAQDAYNEKLQRMLKGTVWTAGHCESWYLDDTGRNVTLWPTYSWAFRRRTRRFDPESYVISNGSGASSTAASREASQIA